MSMEKKVKKIEMSGQTFIIDVKENRNRTWQGTVKWVQEQKQEAFRSTLELIRLLDSAIEMDAEDEVKW